MEHPQIENMMKYGYISFKQLLDDMNNESHYFEDIYGDSIEIGDEYYINKYGEIIHSKNIMQYVIETYELRKKTR